MVVHLYSNFKSFLFCLKTSDINIDLKVSNWRNRIFLQSYTIIPIYNTVILNPSMYSYFFELYLIFFKSDARVLTLTLQLSYSLLLFKDRSFSYRLAEVTSGGSLFATVLKNRHCQLY